MPIEMEQKLSMGKKALQIEWLFVQTARAVPIHEHETVKSWEVCGVF